MRASGNCTIWVIVDRDRPLRGSEQAVLDLFVSLGASGEDHGEISLVALSVPPDLDLREVRGQLQQGDADG